MPRRFSARTGALASAAVATAMVSAAPFKSVAQVEPQSTRHEASPPAASPVDPNVVPRPTIRACRTADPIAIDGRLTERAWALADTATGFTTNLPRVGYPASEKTAVRVLYDERNLYVGMIAYDGEPGGLIVSGLEQDFQTHDSDVFAFSLDTYHDFQNAYLFATNPAGATFDAQVFNDSRDVNQTWEGVVHIETQRTDSGWTAEIAVPFTTLRFARTDGEQLWGINFMRRVRRRNEDGYWAAIDRQYRVHKMSLAGTLAGLSGLRQGRNLTLKPFLSVGRNSGELRADNGGSDVDWGFDVKYGLTQRLTLDATALTDFSQVEVDEEQVNLTRFPLFFPEKRDFFMENAGVFAFGDVAERNYRMGSSPQEFTLFHSRRIGLSEDRQPVPILGGARITGRLGGFTLGLLNVQTRESGEITPDNFTVARVRRTVFGNSDVGLMLIDRQANGSDTTGYYNRAVGVDANLRLLRHMLVHSYVAATDEPHVVGDRSAARLEVAWRDPVWDFSAFVKHVGGSFNPGVGFVKRSGVRQVFATVGAHPQPRVQQIVEFNPYADVTVISDLDWQLETRTLTGGLGVSFVDGGMLNVEYNRQLERLSEPDAVLGVEIGAGEYRFGDAAISYTSSGGRMLSGTVRFSNGGFFDGSKTSLNLTAQLRPSYHLTIDASAQHNEITLSDTAFTADVFGGRVRYAHSTRLFLSALVQYNRSSDELVTNLRFNLIHAPLSDLFLVYTERRDLERGLLLDRVITAKVTRLFSF